MVPLVMLLLAVLPREGAAAGYLAIVTGDVADKACTIVHNDQKLPCTARKLYAGDQLQANVSLDSLKLVVHPAAEMVDLGESRYLFRLVDTDEGGGLLKKFMNRFFEQEKHYSVNTVSRDWGDACRKLGEYARHTPPASAVVLAGETVRFPAPALAKKVSITDGSGSVVYAAPLDGELALRPADAGMAPGRDYVVAFDGPRGLRQMRVHVLDEAAEARLTAAVRSLDAQSPGEASLQAAAYYQLESDLHPQDDYYFLSYQQLPADLSGLPERDAACNILARYTDWLAANAPPER
jgi:hypothetical protein